MYSKNKHIFMI